MSEDLIKYITVKRSAKKKSGYTVKQKDDEYFIDEAPSKARVNEGDKVVAINGIPDDEFMDEDDANALIESIRIVVVPEAKLEEYDEKVADEKAGEDAKGNKGKNDDSDDEEDYEEYERRPKNKGKKAAAAAAVAGAGAAAAANKEESEEEDEEENGAGHDITCPHCNHEHEGLEPDEDGDLVCDECECIIMNVKEDGEEEEDEDEEEAVYHCENCGHDNTEPERNADGNLECAECGEILPESRIFHCEECEHDTIDPERDDDGDLICEGCGAVLPEPWTCEHCNHEQEDPQQDEDGDWICENCGEVLPDRDAPMTQAEKIKAMNDAHAEQAHAPGKNEFGEDGKPVTNPEGKKLTPADMFGPGDVITINVGKSNPRQDAGLKIEERKGRYYVRKVPNGGLFGRTPVIASDKILELNGKDAREYKHVNEMKKVLKDESKISIVVLRVDPDDSDSSASTDIDYDNMAPITPDGVVRDEIEDKDDDTVGYDGHDCGCVWCPDCN